MFTRLPPDPGGIIEAPVEKNVILALREQSINTARRGGWGGRLVFTNRVERGGAIENMVFSGKRMGISLHQQIRRRGGGGRL